MDYIIKRSPLAAAMLLAFHGPLYSPQTMADPGGAICGECLVNTYTTNAQENPSIALDADGDFVITWTSSEQDGSGGGIYAQRYLADGTPAGNEFRVNANASNNQSKPDIALDADGDFVITWTSSAQDGSGDGIYAQRFTADGTTAGSEFLVNTVTSMDQSNSSIAMDADGDFVITWTSSTQDGSGFGIYAQRFNADGTAAGNEFVVNSTTTGDQSDSSIAMDAGGDFVIAAF